MGPPDPGAGRVHAVRERGEGVVRGGGGPAHPADHPQPAAGREAECVQGGGDDTVVLSLHHRHQPGDRGTIVRYYVVRDPVKRMRSKDSTI